MPNKFILAVNSSTERDVLIDIGLPGVSGICFRRDINALDVYDPDAAAWISQPLVGGSSRYVAAGATLTLTAAAHAGKVIKLDTAAGSVVTLPAATGSGIRFRFLVTVLATSNSHVVSAVGSDVFIGIITTVSDDAGAPVKGYAAGATDNTITLNRSTTGSVSKGEYIEIEDEAAGVWAVYGQTSSTGTEATPFSHV